MLILERKPGESIIISENVKVTYLRSKNNNSILIGIAAPKNVSVHREEIHEKIQKEREAVEKICDSFFENKR